MNINLTATLKNRFKAECVFSKEDDEYQTYRVKFEKEIHAIMLYSAIYDRTDIGREYLERDNATLSILSIKIPKDKAESWGEKILSIDVNNSFTMLVNSQEASSHR